MFQSARQICVGLNGLVVADGPPESAFQSARQICVGLNMPHTHQPAIFASVSICQADLCWAEPRDAPVVVLAAGHTVSICQADLCWAEPWDNTFFSGAGR